MNKIRILLAEDHAVVREGTRRVLEQEPDMQVVAEAEDGEEAVRLAIELMPDIALIDIVMPNLDGIEATKRIKEVCPSITVLILSAYDDIQFVYGLLKAGAAGYLLKSVRGKEVVDAIRAVLKGEPVLHPVIARKVLGRFVSSSGTDLVEAGPEGISERETEVLNLAARGLSNTDIAKELSISLRTVQRHFTSVFKKLQVSSRTEAILRGLREGWLTLDERHLQV